MNRLLSALSCFFLLCLSLNVLSAETVTVDAVLAKGDSSAQHLILTGTVEAKQHAKLAPLQAGLVSSIAVEAGDLVEKGQQLMQLDAKLATLQLAQAKANMASSIAKKNEAERLYQEVIELSKKQLVAKTLMAERQSLLEVAKAELIRAQAEIDQQQEIVARHQLKAPFSGVIASRNVNLGEWVSQSTAAFTLVESNALRVKVAIPQEYLSQLVGKSDIAASITPDFTTFSPTDNSMTISATLDRIVPVVNNAHRSIDGFIKLPSDSNLMAGISVQVKIALPNSEQAFIWLPKSAIKQHPDGGTSVFTVENNKAKRVLVKVANQDGRKVAVANAAPEQLYVLTGIELLKDGDPIQVNQVSGDTL